MRLSENAPKLSFSLKSTPFKEALKGIEEIEKGIQQFANTFPEEQKQAKKIFQTFCDSYIKIITYSTVSLMNDSRNFSDMLVTDNGYLNAFKKRLNTYWRNIQRSNR